jgi:hypothetical protein
VGFTIRAIASQFERGDTEGLRNPEIFSTPEVRLAGDLAALQAEDKPFDLLRETKTRMFAATRPANWTKRQLVQQGTK